MRGPRGSQTVRLTDRNVHTLPARNGRRTDYTDEVLPGFFLRVSPSGHRAYKVTYGDRANRKRFTIGTVGRITLGKARQRARDVLASAQLGGDPQAEKMAERQATAGGSLELLAKSFFQAKPRKRGGEWRPATEAVYSVAFDNYILPRFGKSDPNAITPQEVRLFLDGIARKVPIMANRVLEAFRRCYTWALPRGYVSTTPFVAIEKPSQSRKAVRTFTNDEVRQIFAAVQGTELQDLVPLLFHTATRSHETRAMRWSHVDFERKLWRIPPELAKTGDILQQAHEVPLSKGALVILKRRKKTREQAQVVKISRADFVFPAATREGHMDKPNKATAALKDVLGIEDRGFLHHIRRTVADRMKKDLGIAPWIVEAILGHAQEKLIETYMPSSPLSLMRDALDGWNEHLAGLLRAKARKGQQARTGST